MPRFRIPLAGLLLIGMGAVAVAPASAQLMDTLKSGAGALSGNGGAAGGLSGLGLPSLGGANASNIAGLLQYCVQNQLGSAASGGTVKDQLVGKLGGSAKEGRDPSFAAGRSGEVQSQGRDFSLSSLGDQAKKAVCDQVMQHAKSLI